jgi:hypothetical protein
MRAGADWGIPRIFQSCTLLISENTWVQSLKLHAALKIKYFSRQFCFLFRPMEKNIDDNPGSISC